MDERWELFFKNKFKKPSRREVANKSSAKYIEYLRRKGVRIGDECEFFKPATQFVDPSNPEIITIGNKVQISLSCAILTHGFDYSVLREIYPGEGFGSAGPVTIKDNVFIGMRSMILKDTVIGNNCVIGAGSVVRGIIPDNTVIAGNPAKPIMSIEKLYDKYKSREIDKAVKYARALYAARGTVPNLADFSEYYYLFADVAEAEGVGIEVARLVGSNNYDYFRNNHKKVFESFDLFLDFCDFK